MDWRTPWSALREKSGSEKARTVVRAQVVTSHMLNQSAACIDFLMSRIWSCPLFTDV